MLFEWDDANRDHIALHRVTPDEAEQVAKNDPVDLSYDIVEGEERFTQIGQTNFGRILYIVLTVRGDRARVVTSFQPSKSIALEYLNEKRKESYE